MTPYDRMMLILAIAIESRVARIKARVAELTGSMEGVSGPQSPQTPQQSSPAAQQ